MNKVILIGNLTRDPELRTTPTGKKVATCSIATNKTYIDKNSGEKKTLAQFHNLVIWQKPAETFSQYMKKGSKVMIEGELQTRSYQAKDGSTRYVTEIIVGGFEFLSSKPQGESSGGEHSQPAPNDDYSQPEPQYERNDSLPDDEINVENIPF